MKREVRGGEMQGLVRKRNPSHYGKEEGPYEFPLAAVKNDHQLCALTLQKFICLEF